MSLLNPDPEQKPSSAALPTLVGAIAMPAVPLLLIAGGHTQPATGGCDGGLCGIYLVLALGIALAYLPLGALLGWFWHRASTWGVVLIPLSALAIQVLVWKMLMP
jgi:hypothetical protein